MSHKIASQVSSLNFFFFSSRRRHTRLQGDWSSDVCSSDLDGRLYLLDAEWLGSAPLSQTEPGPAIRGGFSSWEDDDGTRWVAAPAGGLIVARSEERRVGKECRSRWSPYH